MDENLAPFVDIEVKQAGVPVNVIDPDNGTVSLIATVNDVNKDDSHNIEWFSTDSAFADLNGEFVYSFEPNTLNEGIYQLDVIVTESNTQEQLTTYQSIQLVIENAIDLSSIIDSDNDGTVDAEEGLADSDGDGIADYLDNDDNTSRIPSSQNSYPIETNPELTLVVGSYVQAINGLESEYTALTEEEIAAVLNDGDADIIDDDYQAYSPLFNFILEGILRHGESAAIVIPLSQGESIPADAVYRKYNSRDGWYDFIEDERNIVRSAPFNSNGTCPAAQDSSYSLGLTVGDNCIELTIEDGGPNDADLLINGSIEDPGALKVKPTLINHAPEIKLSDYSTQIKSGESIELQAVATDSDGDSLTYTWSQLSGAAVSFSNTNSATVMITAPILTADETVEIEVVVSDGQLSSNAVATVLINREVKEVVEKENDKALEKDTQNSGGAVNWLLLLGLMLILSKRANMLRLHSFIK